MAISRESDKFMLRLPDGMRERIKAKAEENGRSMNAEIVSALDAMFPAPKTARDVVEEIVSILAWTEPGLRAKAISLMVEKAQSGDMERTAQAYAEAIRDSPMRYPWEAD